MIHRFRDWIEGCNLDGQTDHLSGWRSLYRGAFVLFVVWPAVAGLVLVAVAVVATRARAAALPTTTLEVAVSGLPWAAPGAPAPRVCVPVVSPDDGLVRCWVAPPR